MKYKVDRLDVNIYASNKEMGQAAAKQVFIETSIPCEKKAPPHAKGVLLDFDMICV